MVSFILVNYNSTRYTIDCVDSIDKHLSRLEKQIIIVDNGSTIEQRRDLTSQLENRNIELVISDVNLGFGNGNNLARTRARGDILIFINNDTLLIDDSITVGIRWLQQDDNAGMLGGNLLNLKREPDISYGRIPNSIPYLFRIMINGLPFLPFRGMMSPVDPRAEKPFRVGYPMGALLIIRRSDMEAVGWFDKNIFLYFEEADLALRMKHRLNKDCYTHPKIKLIHLSGGSSGSANLNLHYFRSWHYFLKKNGGSTLFLLLFTLSLYLLLLRDASAELVKCNPGLVIKKLSMLRSAITHFHTNSENNLTHHE